MRSFRRHPRRMQLQRWFDGEDTGGLAAHLGVCPQCLAYLDSLSRIRSAVRLGMAGGDGAEIAAQISVEPSHARLGPPTAPATAPDLTRRGPAVAASAHRHPARLAALVAAPVLVLIAGGLALDAGNGKGAAPGTVSSALGRGVGAPAAVTAHRGGGRGGAGANSPQAVAARTRDGAGTRSSGRTGSVTGGTDTTAGSDTRSGAGAPATAASGGPKGPLALAVVVPTQGADAAEGTEITQAAQKAVAEANDSGGVFGAPVQLQMVPAEDTAAVAALAGSATAAVGGFGATVPGSVPWILPADPWAGGAQVVATELSPEVAGARLGQDLMQRGVAGTVGVIQGTGPDAALAAGLASEVPTTTVAASSGTCLPAVAALEQQQVTAVAIAGPPDVASSCIAALEAGAWAPPGGVLVPPSSAYAGVASAGVATGSDVYTVLGLPWPESSSAGAARFRADLPGITSYRALVTYAAIEMAVDVSRTTGALTPDSMTGHTWRNDLYDFSGTSNADVQVVEASAGGWVNAP